MAVETPPVNESHEPTEYEEMVLQLIHYQREAGDGEPWGYVTPSYVAEYHEVPRQRINEAMNRLEAAGWVEQVTVSKPGGDEVMIRGLYRFVGDPRENRDGSG